MNSFKLQDWGFFFLLILFLFFPLLQAPLGSYNAKWYSILSEPLTKYNCPLSLFLSSVLNQMIVVGLLVKVLVEEDADALFQINFIENWFTYKNVPI